MATTELHEHGGGTVDAAPEPRDWESIANTDDFKTLVRERGRFTATLGALAMGWFALFILLSAYAESFMAEEVADGLPVAFLFGLSQMLVLWAVVWTYNKRSNTRFMALQQRAGAGSHRTGAEEDRS
jgi:uncharacterized membrane protein (DUF485 family)